MTMRFAALERKKGQVLHASALNGRVASLSLMRYAAFGFASLKDKGLWTIGYHAYTGTIRY